MHGTADPTVAFNERPRASTTRCATTARTRSCSRIRARATACAGMANRKDLTIRYFQFFDHYLKGAPAPKWMTEGVPFLKKDAKPAPRPTTTTTTEPPAR